MDEPTNLPSLADIQSNNNEPQQQTTSSSRRATEFITPPPPSSTSPRRLARLELERRLESIYVPVNSNDYWELQDTILQLEEDLRTARSLRSRRTDKRGGGGIRAIETMLRRSQAKDAQRVYRVTSAAASAAERMGRYREAERYEIERRRAKRMLPQFQLEGLWVGK